MREKREHSFFMPVLKSYSTKVRFKERRPKQMLLFPTEQRAIITLLEFTVYSEESHTEAYSSSGERERGRRETGVLGPLS